MLSRVAHAGHVVCAQRLWPTPVASACAASLCLNPKLFVFCTPAPSRPPSTPMRVSRSMHCHTDDAQLPGSSVLAVIQPRRHTSQRYLHIAHGLVVGGCESAHTCLREHTYTRTHTRIVTHARTDMHGGPYVTTAVHLSLDFRVAFSNLQVARTRRRDVRA